MKNHQKIDEMIDLLPENLAQAQGMLKDKIMPLIAQQERHMQEHYLKKIKKRTKSTKKAVNELYHDSVTLLEQEEEDELLVVDPEIAAASQELARDPALFRKRIKAVEELGLVGETRNIGMALVTLDSRLNPVKETLFSMIAGHQGCGKSEIVFKALELYPKSTYFLITSASSKAFAGMGDFLQYKALIVTEAHILERESEVTQAIRTLQSEGFITYTKQERVAGKLTTVTYTVKGPMSLITTTVKDKLEKQIADRMFALHPNTSEEQTQEILRQKVLAAAGDKQDLDTQAWKLFHEMLESYDVKIPYAEQIFNCMNTDSMPTTARRAFSRILHAIKTVTIVHQEQRQLCDDKMLVAEIGDYAIVYQLFKNTFLEDVGEFERLTDEILIILEQQGPRTPKELIQKMGGKKSTLSDWIKRNIESGYIYWVDEQEQRFSNDLLLKKAQKRGKAYLKVEQGPALPTPYELTLDSRWDVGGEFYKFYDLELEDTTARPEPAHAIDPFRSAA
ncbi:hypothetical protein Dthio_PD2986 [Desulfonatronospira thiodismutans ASO3-1]|uniref:Uncharacterized protein n=1 Tax=Desulfonatronospira thiodismutans ASO3-1 TaxID=555779 RepID=D6SLJ9_9BACT|nr:hypothetical protein [Desulfonatronospira thiodismutans]EFI35560.1 hypothetical protein Dthio_PD2986 [Desulfonatronospira thiodismutans ASO3-1]